ncbi:MAG: hypothetical protein NTX49_09845 [Chlamydiae bacterium]|nr:hypothetical protein [Chlamydiota bacterium]
MTSLLMELSPVRKNKITLCDYDYQKDIENRLLMSQFTSTDLEVLEEILYSSLSTPIKKLAISLEIEEQKVVASLEKLSKTGLLSYDAETVFTDKDMRKYFEAQIQKFDEDFVPGMDFLQSLLRKVPIHILPTWYSIPRTSNNIFDSIIEKYLFTPQIYQRYILELTFPDPVLQGIIDDVYSSKDLEVSGAQLIEKYGLTKEQFEEHMLHLEFNFVCCLGYKKIDDQWHEKVTPFHEWKEYITFLKDSDVPSIPNEEKVQKKRPNDYSFVQDMAIILEKAKKQPLVMERTEEGYLIPQRKVLQSLLGSFSDLHFEASALEAYIHSLVAKIQLIKLAEVTDKKLTLNERAHEWLEMRLESRAMFLYRHPLNRPLTLGAAESICKEKPLREAEKSIARAINKGWVLFEDFFKGVSAPLSEEGYICLKRLGRTWKYALPEYSTDEKHFIKTVVFDWLFEAGIVQVGTIDEKDCFRVTSIGQSLFAR